MAWGKWDGSFILHHLILVNYKQTTKIINHFGAQIKIFWNDLVNIMAADALATQGASASAAMILTMQDKQDHVFHRKKINTSVLQRCQLSIFKMLNIFEIQSEKCFIYDEMVKNLPIFCLISLIFFANIKQKWKFQGLRWVMIKQNE